MLRLLVDCVGNGVDHILNEFFRVDRTSSEILEDCAGKVFSHVCRLIQEVPGRSFACGGELCDCRSERVISNNSAASKRAVQTGFLNHDLLAIGTSEPLKECQSIFDVAVFEDCPVGRRIGQNEMHRSRNPG